MWKIVLKKPLEKMNNSWCQFATLLNMPIELCNIRGDDVESVCKIVQSKKADYDTVTQKDRRLGFLALVYSDNDHVKIVDISKDTDEEIIIITK